MNPINSYSFEEPGESPLVHSLRAVVRNARLLVVDDEAANVAMLEDMLGEAQFQHVRSTQNPHEVLALFHDFEPDLILLDLMMPGMDGIAVMEQLKHEMGAIPIPILMLTADISPEAKRLALSKGARDFLTKPFDVVELLLRIDNLLENRFLHLDLQRQNLVLEERVRARTAELEDAHARIRAYAAELEEAHFETLERLARAGEFRDDDTGQHTHRVGRLTATLAQKLGFESDQLRLIQQAARLHDVGKIGISDTILLKPGKLTDEEFSIMKTHTTIGCLLLEGGHSELIRTALRIAHSHHERWDGSGYPRGLHDTGIPIEARLLAVADVFDALTHNRPYKTAWSVADAVSEITRQCGRQFDPAIVRHFSALEHARFI